MAEKEIPFRQIHLDFHTSEAIQGVCSEFDAEEFAQTLEDAHVNSITLFSCGHHGNLYYDSKIFPEMVHPGLAHRDLLREQSEACRRHGIQVNLYTTIRWNKRIADMHPEWICIDENGALQDYKGKGYFEAGFYKNLCVNTPYRDFLKKQFGEVLETIPGDGVWYDAAFMNECCCPSCQKLMREQGLNPAKKEDRQEFARWTYYDMVRDLTAFAKKYNPDFHVCYNKGHLGYLDKPVKEDYSYFSFESLPGVEWGYLDFPVSAKCPFPLENGFYRRRKFALVYEKRRGTLRAFVPSGVFPGISPLSASSRSCGACNGRSPARRHPTLRRRPGDRCRGVAAACRSRRVPRNPWRSTSCGICRMR